MKLHVYFSLLLFSVIAQKAQSQCSSSFIYSYTGITNLVWFQDKSTGPVNWQRDYTHWNFNDGSSIDANQTTTHTFPLPQIYNVVKETKFSDPGNPSSFCVVKDSLLINAAMSGSGNVCVPHVAMKAKWLTGTTYGISNYVGAGCPYNYREIVGDTGSVFMPGGNAPMPGIFTTQQYYFTYNVTLLQYTNTLTHHINYPNSHNSGGTEDYYYTLTLDPSVHQTPTDCHASFFMAPSDSTMHNWNLQDFSSGNDSLSYSWDFGDGSTSTLASPSHTYSSIGMYTICLTVSSGTCSDTYCETAFVDTTINGAGIQSVSVQRMLVTGLSESKKSAVALKLFPNPASNELNISYPFKGEDYTVNISNQLGQVMLSRNVSGSSIDNLNLSIGELANGLYQVQVTNDKGAVMAKTRFVKQ